ncbi:hypothetical protein BgiMline_000889 [Biomphalaria glabrata]
MEHWYFYFWDGVLVLLLLGWSTGTFTSGMEYWDLYDWNREYGGYGYKRFPITEVTPLHNYFCKRRISLELGLDIHRSKRG